MMRCHEDTVMLRNITGSYGRPVIEVVYGETMIHSTEAVVVGDYLGKSDWGVGMMHHPCLTYPGQYQCRLRIYYFLIFKI